MEPSARQVLLLGKGAAAAPASIYHPAAEAIFASFTTPPSDARKIRINDYVVAGLAGGWWGKFDVKHEYMAADSQAALINWAQPGTYNGVAVNSPTFTADVGFTLASTKYIDSQFNPTTAPSPKFVRDSAAIFGWSLTNVDINGGLVGQSVSAAGESVIIPRLSNLAYYSANTTSTPTAANTDATGLLLVSRTGATAFRLDRNGVQIGTSSNASQSPLNSNIYVGNRAGFYFTGICASFGVLSQLSVGESTSLYQAELAYQAGVATDKIVASFTTPPTAGRKTLIYQYVYDMMAAGAWGDGDADYWFAAADAQASLKNLVNPGTYDATAVNSPTFTVDQGWTCGATKYIDSGFNPSTAPSPKYVRDSAMFGTWNYANSTDGNYTVRHPIGWGVIQPRAGNVFYGAVNGTGAVSVANLDSSGLIVANRSVSTNVSLYRNGVSLAAPADVSVAVGSANVQFGYGYASPISSGMIGASRDATKQLAVYNAKRAYATGVGIP